MLDSNEFPIFLKYVKQYTKKDISCFCLANLKLRIFFQNRQTFSILFCNEKMCEIDKLAIIFCVKSKDQLHKVFDPIVRRARGIPQK